MSESDQYQPEPEEIAEALADTGSYVDPSLEGDISDEQLDEIAALSDDSDTPVFVLAVPLENGNDLSSNQLVSLVHREFPEDGVYYVSRGSSEFRWSVDSTTYGVQTDHSEEMLAAGVAGDRYPTDLGEQLVQTVDLFTSGEAREAHEETFPDRGSSTSGESGTAESAEDDGSPQILGIDAPIFFSGVVVLVAAAVVAWALGRRRYRRGDLALKSRALRQISSAQTREWRRRAETETAELGERIRELEIGHGADDAWTAAIDHYQTATAVLDRSDDAADSIGALVLARRGSEALDQAVQGNSWTPTVACFFNPLHGSATTEASWTTAAGSREVPCCADCRRDIRNRIEPEILDLPTDTTVVHYMDSGAEPWASTGYGALTPDLLGQLRRRQ